ncbi:MAG: hypothetical protein HKP36_15230, partial [Myxococcales bacterium]|nr:hypothetical protein [Deltaproteobacteria bacterium]NNL25794.1 hypothetical protein [Myxococcales bacterium]
MRCFLTVLALSLSLGCSRGQPTGRRGSDVPTVRIALVTDLKGYLEPCGCTSDPLGGIDRLAAQIRALRDGPAPVVFVIAGDTFFDTATIEPVRVDQAGRNAKTLAGILSGLDVAAVLPGPSDRAQPSDTLEALKAASDFPWLAMEGDAELLRVKVGSLRLAVVGVRPGADRDAVKPLAASADADSDLTMALVDGSRRDANRLGAIEGVDLVVQGGLDEDDPVAPREAGRAWLLHASRQGQGLTVVDVYQKKTGAPFVDRSDWSRAERARLLDSQLADLGQKISAWEKSGDVDAADLESQRARLAALRGERQALNGPAPSTDGNALYVTWIPLPKNAPKDSTVEALMRKHDKVVNDANRVAFANRKPPPLGPGDVAYVGSAACSGCHQPAYAWWSTTAHGHAYRTLQEQNKEYNLDCVGCHVTGYERPGGSTVTH